MIVPRPRGAIVLVKPLEGDEITEGGVILPDEVRHKIERGMIVEVGPGLASYDGDEITYIPLDLEKGDVVVWDTRQGWHLRIEGEDLIALHASHVLVVLEEVREPVVHGG